MAPSRVAWVTVVSIALVVIVYTIFFDGGQSGLDGQLKKTRTHAIESGLHDPLDDPGSQAECSTQPRPSPIPPRAYKDCKPVDLMESGAPISRPDAVLTVLPRPFTITLPPRGTGQLVAQNLYRVGVFAPVATELFLALLGDGPRAGGPRLVVDIGMNLGYFTSVALTLGYDVAAFEPQEALVPLVRSTMTSNTAEFAGGHVSFFPCAVGASYSHVHVNDSHADAAYRSVAMGGDIPLVTLSDVVAQDVALLKIDTEGNELGVFNGAEVLLDNFSVDAILVEIKTAESRLEIIGRLAARGYDCHQFVERYFKPLPERVGGYGALPLDRLLPCHDDGGGSEDHVFIRRRKR